MTSSGPEPYRSQSPWNDRRPAVLVLACSDGRYEKALDGFCRESLRLEGYDRLFIPGGVQALRLEGLLPKFAWSTRRWLRFLVERHLLERMILVSHEGCAWYREMSWGPDAARADAERERADLRASAAEILGLWPKLRVEAWHAKPDSGRVAFEPVTRA